jgi:hypothetical protein
MRIRLGSTEHARRGTGATRQRVRRDLESRGVERTLAHELAARLAPALRELPARAYGAALDAAVTAASVRRPSDEPAAPDRAADVAEIQRLMLGFTDELRKLEEGLRILSAFVLRMRTRAGVEGDGVLH